MSFNDLLQSYQPFICGAFGGFFYELIAYYELLRNDNNYEDEYYEKIKKKHQENLKYYFLISIMIGGVFVYYLSIKQSEIWQLIVGYTAMSFLRKLHQK